eukprot:TRINITY_DN3649_c0_g1_i1.p1 TRINITY_DN3649_c0_g1~~TRINITY_DN3649_c0_g1_i1.p1  ORF type:complete len:139 (-),score=22.23 TRINITY_DN3649_c0_g1_i1:332-748(-)
MTGLWISCLAFVALSGVSALTDYYKTLGLEPSALPKDVKKAFRQLALKYHPDKNKSPDAEKQFREIAEGRPEYPHSILFLAHKESEPMRSSVTRRNAGTTMLRVDPLISITVAAVQATSISTLRSSSVSLRMISLERI